MDIGASVIPEFLFLKLYLHMYMNEISPLISNYLCDEKDFLLLCCYAFEIWG